MSNITRDSSVQNFFKHVMEEMLDKESNSVSLTVRSEGEAINFTITAHPAMEDTVNG